MDQHPPRARVNPYTLYPGMVVVFRNGGDGSESLAMIQPRGPVGQCVVQLETGPVVAVSEDRELFQLD
ncbi:hypothetical protein [Micromonospora sp. NPDC051141]|uniref:hypothetical protein n=1 Tax=Micromonospora sp. NPDC051141 TaxID=3364284 RepID=UPI003787FBA1